MLVAVERRVVEHKLVETVGEERRVAVDTTAWVRELEADVQ